ncbi:MAG: SDR family NAD(P)-dependent oxidoreductase [Clostridiales bacterium]|nr:SDR family NAD(P)-dependent oxidoreductase [Clostridiales bacterium]
MPTAIVTGASSGIGKAIANVLLDEGIEVYGIGRTFTDSIHTPLFHPICCDLLDTTQLCTIVKEIQSVKSINYLINCAGVGYYGLHEELNPAKIHEMVTVNVEVPLLLTNLVLRNMKSCQGTIINISSVTAQKSNPHGCAYGATKAALSSFSNSLFDEARKYGIRVVTIQPDMTRTNLYRNANFKEGPTPDTYLLPEEIANAIKYIINLRDGMIITELTIKPQRHQLTKQ